jgi:hypothetical protein
MVDRIGEVIQELPVAIITHVMRKKPSANSPRQPRPLSARFLPSWNSKSCGWVMVSPPRPPTRAIAANNITHWRKVAARCFLRQGPPQHRFQTADVPRVQGLIVGFGTFSHPFTQAVGHAERKFQLSRASFWYCTGQGR